MHPHNGGLAADVGLVMALLADLSEGGAGEEKGNSEGIHGGQTSDRRVDTAIGGAGSGAGLTNVQRYSRAVNNRI